MIVMDAFNYPYRWQQILGQDEATQIQMLEERDRALEEYFFLAGMCDLELPFRWDQIWPGVLAGEGWAIACAEENDRAIESLFANCTCGGVGLGVYITGSAEIGSFGLVELDQSGDSIRFQASGWPGTARFDLYQNELIVAQWTEALSPIDDPLSLAAWTPGDFLRVEVFPELDPFGFEIDVFVEMEGFDHDLFTTWVL